MTESVGPSRAPRATRWIGIALAALPIVLLVLREWSLRPDIDLSDYVQYMAHARALLEGRPYGDTGYIYSPLGNWFAPRAYPPGLPLVLLAGFAVAGVGITVAKTLTLAMSLGFVAVAGRYFGRERGFAIGLGVAVTLAASPLFMRYSLGILSDLPFAGLVWLALLLADGEGEWAWGRSAALTAAAVAAILFRPHGMILIPALGIWGLLNFRRGGWKVLAPTPLLLAGTAVGRWIVGSGAVRNFPAIETLLRHLLSPDLRYHFAIFEAHLYPFASDLGNDVFHVCTVALMLVGLVHFVRHRSRSLAVAFGLLYTTALASMPAADIRFAFPLFPLFVFGLLNGVRLAVGALFAGRGEAAALAWALTFVALLTARTLAAPAPVPLREDPDYRGLVTYVRGRTDAGETMRIASFRPRALAAETGAKGMVLLRIPAPEYHLREWCRLGITHVALGGFGIGTSGSDRARDAMRLWPEAFVTEYRNEKYELVRFDRQRGECPSTP